MNDKMGIAILQGVGALASLGVVWMAYNAKGREWTGGWHFLGFAFLIMAGEFMVGYLGQFVGMILFVVIGLLRLAALPTPHVESSQMKQPLVTPYLSEHGIVFACKACKQPVCFEVRFAGIVVKCPVCQSFMRVPTLENHLPQ